MQHRAKDQCGGNRQFRQRRGQAAKTTDGTRQSADDPVALVRPKALAHATARPCGDIVAAAQGIARHLVQLVAQGFGQHFQPILDLTADEIDRFHQNAIGLALAQCQGGDPRTRAIIQRRWH